MRTWVSWLLLACSTAYVVDPTTVHADDTTTAAGDDTTSIRMRDRSAADTEPLLHLDIMPLSANAEGGMMDSRAASIELGPRARLAAEGRWWQSGLAPSMFAEDLQVHGWRVGAELSYDLGPFRVGVNASLDRVGSSSHRAVGLFAYRTFRLSRWMHAWIMLGISYEQWAGTGTLAPRSGVTTGLSVGTTFR